jgi:hypothetical protein
MNRKRGTAKTSVCARLLYILFLLFAHQAFPQNTDSTSTERLINFRGAMSVTNNGFSFIPTFTLGKPATIINLAVGGKRFSFEPELRFDLEGKPWSFIFIWRYKLIQNHKFQLTAGAHLPAISFRTIPIQSNGASKEVLITQRFLPFELTPNFTLTKNISIGMFYLYALGLDQDLTKHTNFVSLRSTINNIKLFNQLWLKFNPQVYYLQMDNNDGFYFASSLFLSKKNFPLSVATTMNKAIQSTIVSKDFDWNISLIYSFNKNFAGR